MNKNETKHPKVWCDPPSGWKFGFPKIYDRNEHPDFYKWIVEEGYPQSEIDRYEGSFFCRFWYPEEKAVDKLNDFFGKNTAKIEDFHERFD